MVPVADPGFGQGGAQLVGGPTLKREGCTPDFIPSYSLLGASSTKTLGLGGRASGAPLDPLLGPILNYGPDNPFHLCHADNFEDQENANHRIHDTECVRNIKSYKHQISD